MPDISTSTRHRDVFTSGAGPAPEANPVYMWSWDPLLWRGGAALTIALRMQVKDLNATQCYYDQSVGKLCMLLWTYMLPIWHRTYFNKL